MSFSNLSETSHKNRSPITACSFTPFLRLPFVHSATMSEADNQPASAQGGETAADGSDPNYIKLKVVGQVR